MSQKRFNSDLLDFLNNSPTAFHAVASLSQMLEAAGFTRLHEGE
ncbi:MAG TPA: M18 family aminopeptidase, partial [Gammaproteobacteria bacterium]|nr:M18 family aminopeptidase [Gammaproteobacteria bacterium]